MKLIYKAALGALLAGTVAAGGASIMASETPDPNSNQVEFWCPNGGIKIESPGDSFTVPAPPEGRTWTLLVLKAGSGEGENETFANPVVGQTYTRSDGREISHVILCHSAVTTTTTAAPTTTTTTVAPTTTTAATTTTAPTTTTTAVTTTTAAATTTTVAPPPPPPGSTTTTTVPKATTTTTVPKVVVVTPTTKPPTVVVTPGALPTTK